jgi:hypothetical protein
MDETHLKMTNEPEKGGTRARMWGNKGLSSPLTNSSTPSGHVTGVFASTMSGGLLPFEVILSSEAKPDNREVKFLHALGLPRVKAFRDPSKDVNAFFAVNETGSMTELLFRDYCTRIKTFLGKKLSPTWVFKNDDPAQGVISGPFILLVDSGPGRITMDADAIEFRTMLNEAGFHLYAGLPNATAVMQVMDQLYTNFDRVTRRNCQKLVAQRVRALMKARNFGGIIPKISLSRNDLPLVVAGEGDGFEGENAFLLAFSPEQIIRAWRSTGCDGCTDFLKHKKMRDDTPEAINEARRLNLDHNASLPKIKLLGFASDFLLVDIPALPPNVSPPLAGAAGIRAHAMSGKASTAAALFNRNPKPFDMSLSDGYLVEVAQEYNRIAAEKEEAKELKDEEKAAKVDKDAKECLAKFARLRKAEAEALMNLDQCKSVFRYLVLNVPDYNKRTMSSVGSKVADYLVVLSSVSWRNMIDKEFDEEALNKKLDDDAVEVAEAVVPQPAAVSVIVQARRAAVVPVNALDDQRSKFTARVR